MKESLANSYMSYIRDEMEYAKEEKLFGDMKITLQFKAGGIAGVNISVTKSFKVGGEDVIRSKTNN